MAKKFGKFLMATVTLGAIAAGAYYLFQKKDDLADYDFDEDDDFDDFDEDLDDEEDSERKYVDLDLTNAPASEAAEDFKEGLNAAKAEATDKIVGTTESAAKAADKAGTKVEEFFNDDDDDDDGSSDAI